MAKTNSFLGIDLGAGGIKIVELASEKGIAQLVTYGYSQNSSDQIKSVTTQDAKMIGEVLKGVAKKAKVGTMRCITALPTFSVFTSIISVSEVNKKDLPNAIRLEAKKVVPLPLEQMILDWKIISEPAPEPAAPKNAGKTADPANKLAEEIGQIKSAQGKITKVLLTAAPKDLVQKYVDIFKAANFELKSLETEAFALTRALLGNDKSVSMIIDLGASNTNISIIDQGVPILNRGIDLGGATLSKVIAQGLKINFDQAEQFKKDWNKIGGPGQEMPDVIKSALAPLINEVKYIFNFYQTQSRFIGLSSSGQEKIEKIVLTGGSSFIPNLDAFLSKLLNVKVYVGDPWSRTAYPADLKPVLDELGPIMSVAIGLALRNIE